MSTRLSASQVRALKVLAHHDEMSHTELHRQCSTDMKPLVEQGLVKTCLVESNGRDVDAYKITSKGRNAAESYIARERPAKESKVPPEILDAAVLKVRPFRTYGLEVYTDADIDEIRGLCGQEYTSIPTDDIRQQIVNRRKQGAYAKKDEWPLWYRQYRDTDHWQKVADQALQANYHTCSLNADHDEDLVVLHRHLFDRGQPILGSEKSDDLVVLCSKCKKTCRRCLAEVPSENPLD